MNDEAPRLQMARRRRRRTGFVAWLSGLVSVILILGQASVVLHFDLVPHRFCLLHGIEDVHVVGGAKPTSAVPLPGARRVAAHAPAQIVVAHERCALAMLAHERLAILTAARGIELDAPGNTSLCRPALDATLLPGRQELDFAPKIGPPA